ncbi:MAG: restriction endonuclease subunit S [Acidobacteriia bacterium]|nr:restriction endonuclease subunit S [Terriglobia bacterium]
MIEGDRLIEWVDALPRTWDAKRLGSVATVKARLGWKGLKAEEYVDNGFIFLSTPNLKGRDIDFENVNYITRERYEESPDIMLREGDVLMVKDGATLGIIALVKSLPAPATVNGSSAVIRTTGECSSGFLFHWLSSRGIQQLIEKMKGGMGVPHLFQSDLRRFPVAVPPHVDQRRIVEFLDERTVKIDRLIALRRRQMELLREQKAAVIQQTVTRGLDPRVSLKYSGLPWVGEIPKHWEVRQIRHLIPQDRPVMYGIVLPGPNVDKGVPIVKAGNCEPGRLSTEFMQRTTFEIEANHARSRVRAGDVVYAIRGSFGEAEIVPPELEGANLTQDAARLAPQQGVYSKWLWYAVRSRSFFCQMESVAVGATIRGVNIRDLKRGRLPVPPSEEQEAIARFIDGESSKLDALHAAYSRQLDLLSEYRVALIHECVTGRGRVNVDQTVAAEAL